MKYEIDIEGLPEGWELTRLKLPDDCIEQTNNLTISINNQTGAVFSLKKLKPRRIVLEETTELRIPNPGEWYCTSNGSIAQCYGIKVTPALIWKEIKENELDSIPQK